MASRSFNDPTVSDVAVQLRGGATVYADRKTLCRSFEHFEAMLQDSSVELVAMRNDDPEAMIAVLGFVHNVPYPECMSKLAGSSVLLWTHYTQVYMTAAKYGIEALTKHILDELETLGMPGYDNCVEFFNAVRVAFARSIGPDEPLHILLARRCFRRMPLHPRLNNRPEFEALLRSCPKFAESMFVAVEGKCSSPL